MRFHLALIEQPSDEQVIAKEHGANIAFLDTAGIKMGPAGADHETKVPSGLHHGHKTAAHRAHIHPYWIGAAKSAVSWLYAFLRPNQGATSKEQRSRSRRRQRHCLAICHCKTDDVTADQAQR